MGRKLKFCLTIIWLKWLLVLVIQIIKIENLINGESAFIRLKSDISQSCHLNEGQEVHIFCNFLPSIWYYNEQYFIKNHTLSIKAITPEEAGTYSCTSSIRNTQYHNLQWANVTLIVSGKIQKDTTSGKEVCLKVENFPNEPKVLISSNGLVGSTNPKEIRRKISPPVIREESFKNQTVFEHDNVKFQCDVISELEPHFIWLKHDDKLNITRDQFDIAQNPNAEKLWTGSDEPHILRLAGVHSEDLGWYTCIAANSAGETNSSSYLRVLRKDPSLNNLNIDKPNNEESLDRDAEHHPSKDRAIEENPPQFINPSMVVTADYNPLCDTMHFFCPATGYPLPNINWIRNDTEIKRHIGKVTFDKWSMKLVNFSTEDSGIYKCKVCNIHGCIEYSKLVSDSNYRIISDQFSQNETILVNSNTYLECRAVSDLGPDIKWFKYTTKNVSIKKLKKEIPNFSTDHSYLTKNVVILERDPYNPDILTFPAVTHEDEGWYTCVANTSVGQSLASTYMHVVDKLPQQYGLQRGLSGWIIIEAIVVVLFLLGTIFIVYILRKKQRIKTYQWTKKVIIYKTRPTPEDSSCYLQMPVIKIEKQRTKCTSNSSSNPDCGFNEYEIPLDFNWEIPRTQLSLGSTLGEGAFGLVVMAQGSGLLRVSSNAAATCIVAVKMVKEEHTDADMASLVHEMEVMKMMDKHINIINLLGCCSQNGPLWVIVEFAPYGNLKDFLKSNRPPASWDSGGLKRNSVHLEDKIYLTEKHLISFAFQIARGMEYLASKRVSLKRKYY